MKPIHGKQVWFTVKHVQKTSGKDFKCERIVVVTLILTHPLKNYKILQMNETEDCSWQQQLLPKLILLKDAFGQQ